jgi:hypothetical protein
MTNNPIELYRRAKAAQRSAELEGLHDAAQAFAGIAQVILVEFGLDAAEIERRSREPLSKLAVLCRPLHSDAHDALALDLDEWRLCYDTRARSFFVEHEWHRWNIDRPSHEGASGSRLQSIDDYFGEWCNRVEGLKIELLFEAGHAPGA